MKCLIIYDSAYGNTEEIADAMAQAVGCEYVLVEDTEPVELEGFDFIMVGSPTQGGRPTRAIYEFLKSIPNDGLKGKSVAAFDTRLASTKPGFSSRIINILGFAAPRIANILKAKGGRLIDLPEGFIVKDREGPLNSDELSRAAAWARKITAPQLVR